MEKEKINEIVNVLTGLKRHEWNKVATAVERLYDSASAKLELTDAERLNNLLELELNGSIKK